MSNDNNSKNNENSEYNYWKDQSNKEHKDDVDNKNQGNGEYRYSKKNDDYFESYNVKQSHNNNINNNESQYSQKQSYNNNDSNQYSKGQNSYNNQKKPSRVKRLFAFIAKAIAFGLIVAMTFVGVNKFVFNIDLSPKDGNSMFYNNDDKFTIEQTEIVEDSIEDTDVTKVVEDTMPSVVTITGIFTQTYDYFGQQIDEEKPGGGSGIIIDKNDTELLIATNNHVVEGAMPIEVTFIDGESANAIIKGTDAEADLAVIAVDITQLSDATKDAIEIADVLTNGEVKVGEKVVAIGNALGIGQSVTVGYVSAQDREINVDNTTMTLLQTDAAINPGNSGGALLNMNGQVIGINTVKFADTKVEGMGYAIPIDRAMPILNELKSREIIAESEQGYLGVGIRDVTEDLAEMFNWPLGVYVSELVEGGPADQAGILKGDIIIGINDIDVTSTTQLIEKVTSYREGTEVTIILMRNQNGTYEKLEIQATLGKNLNKQ